MKLILFSVLALTSSASSFFERFESLNKWVTSEATKQEKSENPLRYSGEWSVEKALADSIENDLGLVAKSAAAHHAISRVLDYFVDSTNQPLVFQYEVKLQNGLECGGAYVKLLTMDASFDPKMFDDKTPYTIMFGPDRCGNTNQIHFIFRHKNPVTGVYEEKHLINPPVGMTDQNTHVYTLIVNPDQTFEIKIDNQSAKSGNLLIDFFPSVNPPKEISDPTDTKPTEWVDEKEIPDPNDTKPEDWNDDEPEEIEDMDAQKPSDWLENESNFIYDQSAVKPADWNDEEDGDFVPPMIANPKCESASGCGPWTRPMKPNPAYRGVWAPKNIPNPAYKGEWAPRKIPNPEYFEDYTPSDFSPIGAIGIEIWTMQPNIMFDNFYLGHSVDEAEKFMRETFMKKKAAEPATKKESLKKRDLTTLTGKLMAAFDSVMEEFPTFIELLLEDPGRAIRLYPNSFSFVVLPIVAALLIAFALFGTSKASATPTATEEVKESAVPESEEVKESSTSETEATASTEKSDNSLEKMSSDATLLENDTGKE